VKYWFNLYCNLPNLSFDDVDFFQVLSQIAECADLFGFLGILLHFNHKMLDPFILASWIIQRTKRISPIIAVLPNYSSPVATAKKIQSLSHLYKRKVILNMITGAAKSELEQVNETLSHDDRYVRLAEYTDVLKRILRAKEPLFFRGDFYQFNGLQVDPGISSDLYPDFFVAGSSSAGTSTALSHADVFITHPEPVDTYKHHFAQMLGYSHIKAGIKIGIIARPTSEEAWEAAQERYPPHARGDIITKMKIKSESDWLRQMALLGLEAKTYDGVYWMGGFTSGAANNPILVGSYEEVTAYIVKYLEAGVSEIIVAGLNNLTDFEHAHYVFKDIKLE
jgi:alkanesulfonate monooxygenase